MNLSSPEAHLPAIDYTGSQGGFMAMAFGAGWVAASALWVAVGGLIWRFFGEPRIKQLEADRVADRIKCKEETDRLEASVLRLETMLMLHGPQQLRQAMQAVASEAHTEIRSLKAVIEESKP